MRLAWSRKPDVVIAPSIPEWEEHPEDYEEWAETVGRELGLRVGILDAKPPPFGSDLPEFIPLGFAVYLATKVADAAIGDLVDQAMRLVVERAKTRWWTKGKQVKGVIYGPNGEVLREVTWTSTDGEREPHNH